MAGDDKKDPKSETFSHLRQLRLLFRRGKIGFPQIAFLIGSKIRQEGWGKKDWLELARAINSHFEWLKKGFNDYHRDYERWLLEITSKEPNIFNLLLINREKPIIEPNKASDEFNTEQVACIILEAKAEVPRLKIVFEKQKPTFEEILLVMEVARVLATELQLSSVELSHCSVYDAQIFTRLLKEIGVEAHFIEERIRKFVTDAAKLKNTESEGATVSSSNVLAKIKEATSIYHMLKPEEVQKIVEELSIHTRVKTQSARTKENDNSPGT